MTLAEDLAAKLEFPDLPEGLPVTNTALLKKIDAAVAGKNLLLHPFYVDWQAGKLSKEALQLYAAQYYRHVEAFPEHLRALAERTGGKLRKIVKENLAEEENPEAPHPKLWRDFAAALGVDEETLASSPWLPETRALVEKFRGICQDRPVAAAVGALYAYEAQVPEIAATKFDGLQRFYGINAREGLAYFAVHQEVDKAHRAAWRRWLQHYVRTGEDEILAATNEGLDALWGALDGVKTARAGIVSR